MQLSELIAVARGDLPASLLLKNAKIVNTFNGEIEEGDIAILDDRIAGIGDYTKAEKILDLDGFYVAPGFINGHTHIESSMLHPAHYATAVMSRGTTSIITDLHEIANVCGKRGLQFVMRWAQKVPLDMFFMAPSCVPATNMETSGAELTAQDILEIINWPGYIGLGEVMNYPGVIYGVDQVLHKIQNSSGKVLDGHSPGLMGKQLNAYLAAGIQSDHECTSIKEAKEKLSRGMHIMIREGTTEKNLEELLPLVNDSTINRCFFVVDDRSCADILNDGDIDAVVRKAVRLGLDPIKAIQMATINTARYFKLHDRGAIAPGYISNLIVFRNLSSLDISMVFHKGTLTARDGKPLVTRYDTDLNDLSDTVNIKPLTIDALRISAKSADKFPVIEVIPEQIVTKNVQLTVKTASGEIIPDTERDILKLAVIERHKATGNIGLGLVKGFGLVKGAIASSVAHDSHNIIVVGTNDRDIYTAISGIEQMKGGLIVCNDGRITASMPLPIAGLLSSAEPREVSRQFKEVENAALRLGRLPASPFALLSFMALPVIPELKLTDMGLVDVVKFQLIR